MYKFEYSFTWTIENFSFCNEKNGESVTSNDLYSDNFVESIGHLSLCPRGVREKYSKFISCTAFFFNDIGINFHSCEIKAIGASGKTLKTHKWDDISTQNSTIELECLDFLAIKVVVEDAESCARDTLTVCCKLLGENSIQNVLDDYSMRTVVGVDRHTFLKRIYRGETVSHTITYGLKIKFDFSFPEENGGVQVSILKSGGETMQAWYIDCTFTLALTDVNYNFKAYSEKAKRFFPPESSSKWDVKLENLSKEYRKHSNQHRLKGKTLDSIKIYCDFSSSNGLCFNFEIHKNGSTCTPNNANASLSTTSTKVTHHPSLQEDLQTLLNSGKLSDVKLLVDKETIEVHKIVLIARSPVFAAMFDHQDMAESRRGVVDIVDIDAHTLKSFLQFLYTDAVDEMNHEMATNLMMAAEKYQVLSLKEKCAAFLKKEMTVDNVCEMLSLADVVNHEHLKSTSVEFIVANSSKILSSPQWRTWMKNNMVSASLIFSELTQIHASSAKNASGIN